MAKIKGAVYTVGGTPEPIIVSLRRIRPECVAFICSKLTKKVAEGIAEQVRPEMPEGFNFRIFITVDEEQLYKCYRQVEAALQFLTQEQQLDVAQIRIDYTGGTKTMSAAAVLAAAPDGYQFVYVGGIERDKDGKGIVISGKERIVYPDNPWQILEEPETSNVLNNIANHQWFAAQQIIQRLWMRADKEPRELFAAWTLLVDGLAFWDRFQHDAALQHWDDGQVPARVKKLALEHGRPQVAAFASACLAMTKDLKTLAKASSLMPANGIDPLALDLFANAERRANAGQFDEAVLRVYRALEFVCERRLWSPYRIDPSKVAIDKLPLELKARWKSRRKPLQIGLQDRAELLSELGDAIGIKLYAALPGLDTSARSGSWLIHGTRNPPKSTYETFRDGALAAIGATLQDIPRWPDFTDLKSAARRGGQ
jgi:CRISPR-associated protein (TIGR02710 family)